MEISSSSALVILTSGSKYSKPESKGVPFMSAREIQDEKAIGREMFVQQAAHANADVSTSPLRGATICSTESRRDYTLESTADDLFLRSMQTHLLLSVIRVGAANLGRVLRQLEVIGKLTCATNRVQGKSSILLPGLGRHRGSASGVAITFFCNTDLIPIWCTSPSRPWQRSSNPTVLFCIHRSVVVNISAVEEIRPFTDGEYRLRQKRWEGILGNSYIQTQPL